MEIYSTRRISTSMNTTELTNRTSAFEKALRGVLRPLVRAMIAKGVTAPVFYRIVKQTYVDVAGDDLGEAATDSRISVTTGVHRRDVKAMRLEGDPDAANTRRKVSMLGTVVGRWLSGDDTTDENGSPMPLPRSGQDGVTFETLVQSVSRDVRPRTVLDELVHQKIATLDDDMVALSVDALVGPADIDQRVHFFSLNVGDHMSAAVENLLSEKPSHFERAVFYNSLSEASIAEIEAEARKQSNDVLLDINKRARTLQDRDVNAGAGTNRFRFGVFFYREDEEEPVRGTQE